MRYTESDRLLREMMYGMSEVHIIQQEEILMNAQAWTLGLGRLGPCDPTIDEQDVPAYLRRSKTTYRTIDNMRIEDEILYNADCYGQMKMRQAETVGDLAQAQVDMPAYAREISKPYSGKGIDLTKYPWAKKEKAKKIETPVSTDGEEDDDDEIPLFLLVQGEGWKKL